LVREILGKPMEFNSNETYTVDDKQPFAKNDTELKERLRKSLKYAVMARLAGNLETQEAALERKDTVIKIQTVDSLEAQARRSVLKSQEDFTARWQKLKQRKSKAIM
jgi:carboxyl-terminal processing protease